ncbi:MAG: hypothetical protein HYV07_11485 [Deltaproteobacteria bacterium]|nr:hypothetical protein [Deltaproteobacteria bacterium]
MSCSSKWRSASTSASALVALGLVVLNGAASAEGTSTSTRGATAPSVAGPGSEAPDARTPDGGAKDFAQAMEAMLLEDFGEAARLAYLALGKTTPSAEKYESQEFVMAEALEKLGLYEAAAEYYFAVAEGRQNPALFPRAIAGLERLARKGLLDEQELVRSVLVEADLASVPPDVADFLHYSRGLANLRAGYRRWSERELTSIRPSGYYREKTELVRVVTSVKDGDIEGAAHRVDLMLKRVEPTDDELKRGPFPAQDEEIKRELEVLRARLLYERGQYQEAIEAYRASGATLDTSAGDLLLERAWAHFGRGQDHDAMGLLYALAAPSNVGLFLPEQYLLRGLIYQRFCHFLASKSAIRDFRKRYAEELDALANGIEPTEIPGIRDAANKLPSVVPLHELLERVKEERERLPSLEGSLEDGGLFGHLVQLYAALESRTQLRYGRAFTLGAQLAAERLLEAQEQSDLLEYEVGVSIFKPIAQDPKDVRLRTPAEEVPSSGPLTYYAFDDEFWTDELENMRFLIQDRCVE